MIRRTARKLAAFVMRLIRCHRCKAEQSEAVPSSAEDRDSLPLAAMRAGYRIAVEGGERICLCPKCQKGNK